MSNIEAVNLAELGEEYQRLTTTTGGFGDNFVQMPEKEGFVVIRVLPPKKGGKLFIGTRIHRINEKNIHCPRELVKKGDRVFWVDKDPNDPCPCCMLYKSEYEKSKTMTNKVEIKQQQDYAKQFKPYERFYYNCIVRSQINKRTNKVEENVGPKIFSAGEKVHDRILVAFLGKPKFGKLPLGDITDVKNGRDFRVVKAVSDGDNYANYDQSEWLEQSPLGEKDQVEKWLDSLHDLSKLRIIKSTDEMKTELKKHLGLIQETVDTSFDPSEFQKKPATLEDQVRTETQKTQKVEQPKAEPSKAKTLVDEAMAEPDLLDVIHNM
jgi:hypothetical protein